MSVFARDNISQLVLKYVEWLERRRGCRRTSSTDKWQPVSCATVANYLNSLVAIVKFQLRQQLDKRDQLIDQLRNLRSQAESYSFTDKRFEKAHPEWCTWQELQVAREKCRSAFDEMDSSAEDGERDSRAYLLQLRELCLLCLFTICPPPRCSVIRLLEWDKTLVVSADQWQLDLTDITHAATRLHTEWSEVIVGAVARRVPPSCLFCFANQIDRSVTHVLSGCGPRHLSPLSPHDGGPCGSCRSHSVEDDVESGVVRRVSSRCTLCRYCCCLTLSLRCRFPRRPSRPGRGGRRGGEGGSR